MEKHKKCSCGEPAEWVFDSEFYCEYCLGVELDIQEVDPPRRCEQCGTSIKGSYFTDNDNAFCSRECAFEYYDAKKLEKEEDNDNESGN
jgi:predicted nucleic acid-binding Zn ribbon protein